LAGKYGTGGDNTLLVLSSIYQSLTKTEKKIADVILKDPNSAVYATVTDMAENTSVGETSVLRLCRKLGFRSYQEFKLALAKELAGPSKIDVYQDAQGPDDLSALARSLTAANASALENTLALLDLKQLERAIESILKADSLLLFGVSASGNVAIDGKHRLIRFGLKVDAITDSHLMAMTASLMGNKDVAIAISTSGSTKDVVDAAKIAKKNGAFLVCITSQSRSPLAQFGDAVLLINSRETPLQGGSFASKLSQIHVLDILSTTLAARIKDRVAQASEKTAEAVADKLY